MKIGIIALVAMGFCVSCDAPPGERARGPEGTEPSSWSEMVSLPEKAFVGQTMAQLGDRVVHVDRAPPQFRLIDPSAPRQERATLMFQPRAVSGYAGLCSVAFLVIQYDEAPARHETRLALTPTDFERVVRYRVVGDVRPLPIDAPQDQATQMACTKVATPSDLLITADLDVAQTTATLAQAIRDTWKEDRPNTPIDCQLAGGCAAVLTGLAPSQIGWTARCEEAMGRLQSTPNQSCMSWTLRDTKDRSGASIRFDVRATPEWAGNEGAFHWRLDRIVVSRPPPPID